MADDFDAWVRSLPGTVSADGMVLLREVFDAQGSVSVEEAERIGHEYQAELARVAVEMVGRDVVATLIWKLPPLEYRRDDPGVRVAYWGRFAASPMFALRQADATVEVADFFQGEVMEDLHRAWPECSEHGSGLHPKLREGGACWFCRTGAQVVAEIGALGGHRN